jgi:undecaprenyl-diphosphatase
VTVPRRGRRAPASARRPADRWAALVAAGAYVGLGVAVRGRPGRREWQAFRATNHDTRSRPLLRVPQQLGTPWVLPAVAVAAFLGRRPRLAVAAAAALPLEKALEVGLKKVLGRLRPAQVDPDVELHADAPVDGPSYPSGHVAIPVSALALAWPDLPPWARAAGTVGVPLSGWVRVRQGAHWPTDALGGVALGVLVATGLRAVVGQPAR